MDRVVTAAILFYYIFDCIYVCEAEIFMYMCAPSRSSQRLATSLSRAPKLSLKCVELVSVSQSNRSLDAEASLSTIVAICWLLLKRIFMQISIKY